MRQTRHNHFVTTHYMDEAEYCNRVSIMVDGRIEALGYTISIEENLWSCFHG
jgi:ABC-type multidrug transport system ATPase subunit